jgi:AcrR family transcriptional regulator
VRRGDEKRQAILDVAERLFYLKGYEQTSVQDVLDVLGSSKGSFYHHFESKHEVLQTLCQIRAEKALNAAEEALVEAGESLKRLNTLLYYALPIREGEEQFLALLFPMAEKEDGRALLYEYARALEEAFSPMLRPILAQAGAERKAFLYYPSQIPQVMMALLNQCWQAAAQSLMDMHHQGGVADPGLLAELMQAYRFAMERVLDAPYGSLEIISVPELTRTAQNVLIKMRLGQ